jgi:arabinose-5-phosphate isomerase
LACAGTLFFSGIRKSEFSCNKMLMSPLSMGTRSAFLNPANALHADIGNCGPDNLLILFSKSGSTEELIRRATHLFPQRDQREPR